MNKIYDVCNVCNLESYAVGHYDETGRFHRLAQKLMVNA